MSTDSETVVTELEGRRLETDYDRRRIFASRVNMKSKTKSKSNTHPNPEHHTATHHANPHPTPTTHPNPTHQPTSFEGHNPQHGAHENLKAKTCEEVETGGFGSFDETMATSDHCTERATEFCSSCSKSLCGVHYDALHRGHDNFTSQNTGHGLIHH